MNPVITIPDWNLIRLLAARSARAYDEHTVCDPKTDAQALVVAETINGQPAIIVAFRGSKEPKDFIHDAEAWMSDLFWAQTGETASVHHGFLEDFEAIDVETVAAVKSLLAVSPTAPIHITGHSLGGALATLCALEFKRQNLPVASVITFGCPRVGNSVFRDIYNAALGDRSFRVVNQNDIVPRVPGVLLDYRHCGNELFLAPGTAAPVLNPALWYLLACDALGLWAAYRNKSDVLITEHFIAAYQQRIQGI
jgi:pimeloyl-ACP methyl ester carboxylesterase